MRKGVWIVVFSIALSAYIAGGGALAGTRSSAAPETTAQKPLKNKVIWYMDVLRANPGLDALAQGANRPLMLAGGKMIRSFALNAAGQLDISVEAQAFDRATASKPAAIIYFVLDPKSLKPQVKRARAAGIPVFAMAGKPAPGIPANAYVQSADRYSGTLLGKTLAGALPKAAKWTVIAGLATPNVEAELDGVTAEMNKAGMTFVGSRDEQRNLTDIASGGQEVMQGILQRYPDVKGIFAFNDDTAIGAIAAIKAAGKTPGKDIIVVSRNGNPVAIDAIKKGELYATCDIDVVTLGLVMGRAIRAHLTKQRVYKNNAKIKPPDLSKCVYTKENVDKYVPWDKRIPYVKITER